MTPRAFLITLALLAAVARSPAAPTPPAPAAPDTPPAAQADKPAPTPAFDPERYHARLTALTPARPALYLELAEEIAAEEPPGPARDLARHLYVLALLAPARHKEVQTSSGPDAPPPWLASSACLGLAALADNEPDRRWLTALANTLAPGETAAAQAQSESTLRDPAAVQLATALGLVRSGDGRRAAKLLDKPAVSALLSRYEGLMTPGGLSGGGERVRALAAKYPVCPECRNRRYTKNAEGIHLCPLCGGRPGPKVSVEEMVGQLRLESMLLSGVQRSWAAQVVADGGAPMRELDPEVLIDVYGVDPSKALWRDGAWVASAPAAPAPPPAASPAPSAPAPSIAPAAPAPETQSQTPG